MSKIKVEVTGAVVDGFPIGSTIEIDERSAKSLEAKGYVRILMEEKPEAPQVKKESAPKKPTKASVKKPDKSKKDK